MANLFEPNFRTFTNFQKKFQHTEITEKISECLIRPTLQSDKKLGVRKKIISYHKALFFFILKPWSSFLIVTQSAPSISVDLVSLRFMIFMRVGISICYSTGERRSEVSIHSTFHSFRTLLNQNVIQKLAVYPSAVAAMFLLQNSKKFDFSPTCLEWNSLRFDVNYLYFYQKKHEWMILTPSFCTSDTKCKIERTYYLARNIQGYGKYLGRREWSQIWTPNRQN